MLLFVATIKVVNDGALDPFTAEGKVHDLHKPVVFYQLFVSWAVVELLYMFPPLTLVIQSV